MFSFLEKVDVTNLIWESKAEVNALVPASSSGMQISLTVGGGSWLVVD